MLLVLCHSPSPSVAKADAKVIASRSRSIPTPRDVQEALQCPLRCCRAPELAAGDPFFQLRNRLYLD